MTKEEQRREVREGYSRIAAKQSSLCGCSAAEETGKKIGYSEEELDEVPEGANMGLGCGNPVALASLKEGETVVDLGSGGGFDCFLAAKKVGKKGKVIGVDMTSEMLDKARQNARKDKYDNVEFRLGEIENLPVADKTADVVVSNCVINLTPDKSRVFKEAFRVLKSGGRLMISDIVLLKELPEEIKQRAHPTSCVQGAIMMGKYIRTIKQAGFRNVKVIEKRAHSLEDLVDDPDAEVMTFNPEKNSVETKNLSELGAQEKEIVKEIAKVTLSIDVLAIKP